MIAARIFVVEDEAFIAMDLCHRLETLGYEIAGSAATGERAVLAIPAAKPDVVLLDIQLAGELTGLDVARGLRHSQPDTAVVFLTAFSDEAILREARLLEPAAFLVKPFEERELHATVQMAHFRKLAQRERRERLEERRQTELRLLRAQQDESLGRMASAVAQSVSNGLGGILGLIELARQSVDAPQACAALLANAADEVQHLSQLSHGLRRYAGGDLIQPRRIDLAVLCRSSAGLLEAALPGRVQLDLRTPVGVGTRVQADPGLLRDALVQLVSNAAEALAGREGAITVEVSTAGEVDLRDRRIWPEEWLPAGRIWASVEVRDGGSGVPPDVLERIFDPFFSTKFLGRGLGLALVLSTARALGGAVAVRTSAEGSAFCLLLPLDLEDP